MITLDKIRLTGLLRKSPANVGLFYLRRSITPRPASRRACTSRYQAHEAEDAAARRSGEANVVGIGAAERVRREFFVAQFLLDGGEEVSTGRPQVSFANVGAEGGEEGARVREEQA